MRLKPGMAAEYRRRHDAIWPELLAAHTRHGIRDYSIYLDETTDTLFAVRKLTEDENAEAMADAAIVRRWWQYNADLMDCHADASPVCRPLTEMFHMD